MCDKGEIKRISYSYTTKNGKLVNVKSTCVPDKGKPGKGPKLIIIPKEDQDLLGKYGYNLRVSYEDRINILKKALKDLSELKVLRYINALRTLHKSNEKYYNKLDKDLKWIQADYKKHK